MKKHLALVACTFLAAQLTIVAMISNASAQTDETPAVATDDLFVAYQPEEERIDPPMIDELEPETVLTIRLIGFDGDTTGSVKQCIVGSTHGCQNVLSVRSDDRGAATFQYLVTNSIGARANPDQSCRLGGDRCTLEIEVGDKSTIIDTVFVDKAPRPGRLEVTPHNDLLVGDTVSVRVSNFQPDTALTVMVCANPSARGTRCGLPGPAIPVTIGPDGAAVVNMTLTVTEVGSDHVACGRRVVCSIVVMSDELGTRAVPAKLSFTDFPGADYAPTRVIAGLAIAFLLVVTTGWLVRSTDWNPPREADSTLIDNAEFADLDLEAAQFDERSRVSTLQQQMPIRGDHGLDQP